MKVRRVTKNVCKLHTKRARLGTVHFLRDRGAGGIWGGGSTRKKMASKGGHPKKYEEKGGVKRKKAMKKWYEVFIN